MSLRAKIADGSSADFPTDADGRVMHLQVRPGQLANRVLSVGDAGRARRIAEACFDGGRFAVHPSTRGFGVYTGLFEGTPVSIVATGMVSTRAPAQARSPPFPGARSGLGAAAR